MLQRIQRLLRHRWFDERTLRRTLPPDALQRLTRQVQRSEQQHSGEIRIYVEAGLPSSYLWRKAGMPAIIRQRALSLFGKLRVWDTEHNNGVLIYLLLAEQAIEIVADRGLHRHVTPAQWQAMIDRMSTAFREDRYEAGLMLALEALSSVLRQHFPVGPDDLNRNELPDAPVLGPLGRDDPA
jgi:uncharacterized membrane protein